MRARLLHFILGLGFFAAFSALAISPGMRQRVLWETRSNAVFTRSSDPFPVEHYEIPLELVGAHLGQGLPAPVRQALIFRRDGKSYLRWIINPKDTVWQLEVAEFLVRHGISAEKHTYFTGYLLASRTIVVEEPGTGLEFQIKVSTNRLEEDTDPRRVSWHDADKKQTYLDALDGRMIDEYIREVSSRVELRHLKILPEPAAFGIAELDQGMVVRLPGDISGETAMLHYLSGFSAVHEETGRKIAELNGSSDPAEFWNEHYNQPLARALAEFAAHFGLTFDSPHSQNFLIELDGNFRPTGRIVIHDLSSVELHREFFESIGREEILERFSQKRNIVTGARAVGMGILHDMPAPSWLRSDRYMEWGRAFFEQFESSFSRLTGIPRKELLSNIWPQRGGYLYKYFLMQTPGWKRYLSLAECFQGAQVTSRGKRCPDRLTRKSRAVKLIECEGAFL